jgi:hypothetical protein
MAIKPVDALVEPFQLLKKDFGYYLLRTLVMLGIVITASFVFGLIAGASLISAFAALGITNLNILTSNVAELIPVIQGMIGLIIVLTILLILLVILIYSVILGMLRDFIASILEGKKQYRVFFNPWLSTTYIFAWIILMIPIVLISALLIPLGLGGTLLVVPLIIAYVIFLFQFQILPSIVSYQNQNGIKALGTNWNMLQNQRWNIIGAVLLLFLIAIPVGIIQILIEMIPFIGELLSLPITFFVAMYSYLWIANLYKQALSKT